MGNCYFDLVSCCFINKFEINESREFVKYYVKLMNIDEYDVIVKFDLYIEIVVIINDLWFVVFNVNKV